MKFSIIIPIHNAQHRLKTVLGSILTQSKKDDFEVICVCDACSDNSALMCEQILADTPHKLAVTNYGNDGLARSKGLDIATGEWILFLDDDDWWLHDEVLRYIDNLTDKVPGIDIFQFGFVWKHTGIMKSTQQDGEWVNVWSKCYRREFIGDVRFPEVYSISDFEFNKLIYEKKPIVFHDNTQIYYYNYLREGSISSRKENK